jgi:hypothetical protein
LPWRHLTGEWSAELSRPELARSRLSLAFGELVVSISQRDGDLLLLIVAQNRELDLRLRFHLVDVGNQLGRIVNLFAVGLQNDVARPQSSTGRRSFGSYFSHLGSFARLVVLGIRTVCIRAIVRLGVGLCLLAI